MDFPPRPTVTSTRSQTRTLVGGALLVALLTAAALAFRWSAPWLADPAWIKHWVAAYGPLAPLVFVLLQAAQVVFAPVPGQVLAFAGGYLFGFVHGTAYSLLGAALGSTAAFLLARRYGRPYVERVVPAETLAAFDGLVERDGRFALFVLFFVPGLPDDAICFMAGVTRLPIPQLVAISVVGRVPGYLLVSYAGSQAATANYLLTTGILLGIAGASAVVYWQRDAVLDALR